MVVEWQENIEMQSVWNEALMALLETSFERFVGDTEKSHKKYHPDRDLNRAHEKYISLSKITCSFVFFHSK